MKPRNLFLIFTPLLLISCSFSDLEKDFTISTLGLDSDDSIESVPSRHLSDNDLLIKGDSVFLAFGRDKAIKEGVSLREYDLAQRALDGLNTKIQSRIVSNRDVNPNWTPSLFQVGFLFCYPYGGSSYSPSIFLPYEVFNVYDAVGVDCSFASYTDDYSIYFHSLAVFGSNTTYGVFYGIDNEQCGDNFNPVTFPIRLEYSCLVFSGHSACTWATYGFNDNS